MTTFDINVDTTALERLRAWGGNRLLAGCIDLFLEHSKDRVGQLQVAVHTQDLKGIQRGAHSLKSTAAQLGLTALRELAAAFEQAAEASNYAVVAELGPLLEPLYHESCRYLEEFA